MSKTIGGPMFFHLTGKYLVKGSRIHVATPNMRPWMYISGDLASRIALGEMSPIYAELKNKGDYHSPLIPMKSHGVDKLLVFWSSSHPRQKLRPALSRGFTRLFSANYGSSVIGLMDPSGCIVFQYREVTERVFYDPDTNSLVERISDGHK